MQDTILYQRPATLFPDRTGFSFDVSDCRLPGELIQPYSLISISIWVHKWNSSTVRQASYQIQGASIDPLAGTVMAGIPAKGDPTGDTDQLVWVPVRKRQLGNMVLFHIIIIGADSAPSGRPFRRTAPRTWPLEASSSWHHEIL
jgi:hypothetical protein